MIQVRGLSKDYAGGVKALDDVSLDVEPGQFVALIGPSGAGKSSLLRCLNGFVTPTAGRVTVDGAAVTGAGREELRRIRARMGFVFQQFNLLPRLSVLDNVLVGRLRMRPGGGPLSGGSPPPTSRGRTLRFTASDSAAWEIGGRTRCRGASSSASPSRAPSSRSRAPSWPMSRCRASIPRWPRA